MGVKQTYVASPTARNRRRIDIAEHGEGDGPPVRADIDIH
jgi:hypothetical protein